MSCRLVLFRGGEPAARIDFECDSRHTLLSVLQRLIFLKNSKFGKIVKTVNLLKTVNLKNKFGNKKKLTVNLQNKF